MAAAAPVHPPLDDNGSQWNKCPVYQDRLQATWKEDVQARMQCCTVCGAHLCGFVLKWPSF